MAIYTRRSHHHLHEHAKLYVYFVLNICIHDYDTISKFSVLTSYTLFLAMLFSAQAQMLLSKIQISQKLTLSVYNAS